MNVFAKAPNGVIVVCATVIIVTLIGSVTILVALNKDTHTLFTVIQTILSAGGIVVGSGGLLYAGAAAKQADTAATAITNGVMDKKIRDGLTAVLIQHDKDVHGIEPPSPGA